MGSRLCAKMPGGEGCRRGCTIYVPRGTKGENAGPSTALGMTAWKAMDSMIEMVGTAGFEPTTSTV